VIVWLAAQRSTFHAAAYAIIAVVNRQIAIPVATRPGLLLSQRKKQFG
jgi:hypothetical protein